MHRYMEILLRRRNKMLTMAPPKENILQENIPAFLTFQMELLNLGYMAGKELSDRLLRTPKDTAAAAEASAIDILKKLKGDDRKYRLLYPGFPQEVMEKTDMELLWNALAHYWSGGTPYPKEIPSPKGRPLKLDIGRICILKPGTPDDLADIAHSLASSPVSVSETDMKDLTDILSAFSTWEGILPDAIPFREIKAQICALILETTLDMEKKSTSTGSRRYAELTSRLYALQDTPADVLRTAAAFSKGDPSLAGNTRFISFPRTVRRKLCRSLDTVIRQKGMKNAMADMLSRRETWKRLFKHLSPQEYGKTMPGLAEAAHCIRNRKACPYRTVQSDMEHVLRTCAKSGDTRGARELLSHYPGMLARRMDSLLRTKDEAQRHEWLWACRQSLEKMPTPMLATLQKHFEYRTVYPGSGRVFLPKGRAQNAFYTGQPLPDLDPGTVRIALDAIGQELRRRFAMMGPLGDVYIDRRLASVTLPKSQRSASRALKTIPRGSRIALGPDTHFLRAFIWWTNMRDGDRVDLDISAGMYDDCWNFLDHISWRQLRGHGYDYDDFYGILSGDITDGGDFHGKGVAEFLDIDIQKARSLGYRYAVLQVHSYTGQPFREIEHASFGWMERDALGSGRPFEPATVTQRIDLDTDSAHALPAAIDLETKEIIWCGMAGKMPRQYDNSITHTVKGAKAMLWACSERPGPDMYSLFLAHAEARGHLVGTPEEAQTLFTLEPIKELPEGRTNISAFQTELIQSRFMA